MSISNGQSKTTKYLEKGEIRIGKLRNMCSIESIGIYSWSFHRLLFVFNFVAFSRYMKNSKSTKVTKKRYSFLSLFDVNKFWIKKHDILFVRFNFHLFGLNLVIHLLFVRHFPLVANTYKRWLLWVLHFTAPSQNHRKRTKTVHFLALQIKINSCSACSVEESNAFKQLGSSSFFIDSFVHFDQFKYFIGIF